MDERLGFNQRLATNWDTMGGARSIARVQKQSGCGPGLLGREWKATGDRVKWPPNGGWDGRDGLGSWEHGGMPWHFFGDRSVGTGSRGPRWPTEIEVEGRWSVHKHENQEVRRVLGRQ